MHPPPSRKFYTSFMEDFHRPLDSVPFRKTRKTQPRLGHWPFPHTLPTRPHDPLTTLRHFADTRLGLSNTPLITIHLSTPSTPTTDTPPSEPYLLHTTLLRASSHYFTALLDFPGLESTTSTLHLNLTDPIDVSAAFPLFVEFIYRGTYAIPPRTVPSGDHAILHAKVYVLADRLIVPELKRESLKRMHELLGRRADLELTWDQLAGEVIEVVYGGTEGWLEREDGGTDDYFKPNMEPMRELIASYVAKSISGARARPCMIDAFRRWPELMENMLFHVSEKTEKLRGVDYFLARVE